MPGASQSRLTFTASLEDAVRDADFIQESGPERLEIKRDLYTANFVFVFKSNVPNEVIPINPLGLAITYFREDQAFK